MPYDRRTFVQKSALAGLGAMSGMSPTISTAKSDELQQQKRTTGLGSREQEFYLAKITVSNLVRSYQFYTEIVGLRLATSLLMPPTDADPEQDFRELPLNFTGTLADPIFVLVKRRGVVPTRAQAQLTTIGVKVTNSPDVLERAARAGYRLGRRDAGKGAMTFAMLDDPDGYVLELIVAPPLSASCAE
jgi:catechol 2,3-dioxygenase-like lactoylglutathione lyase family enzyme